MVKVIAQYKNGNTMVTLFNDGTKIRETNDDEFRPEFPENCDMTISTVCDNGCEFCYMNCKPDGEYADFEKYPFLNAMHKGMELAINLNFPAHPKLMEFLEKMSEQGVFVNATVSERHFMKHRDFIRKLTEAHLLWGLGISYAGVTDNDEFINAVKEFPTAVIHTIAGLITYDTVRNLSGHGLKLLVLGYKNIGRGESYWDRNNPIIKEGIDWIAEELPYLTDKFRLISFDNLAIEQLRVRDWIDKDVWDERYQGEEGNQTFYIDLVHGTFARDSLIKENFPIGDKSLKEMFEIIRQNY